MSNTTRRSFLKTAATSASLLMTGLPKGWGRHRPRSRVAVLADPRYHEYRRRVIEFLDDHAKQSRSCTHETAENVRRADPGDRHP